METLLQLIERYGLALVMLTLIVLWLKPKLDQGWALLVSRMNTDPIDHKNIEEIMDIDVDLNALLIDARHELDAGYATIWQFHNGATSLSGIPFLRISATHQQVRAGYSSWARLYQNIPVSLFIACKSFSAIMKDRSCAVVHKDQPAGDEPIIGILEAHDLNTMTLCPVRDSTGRLVALLTFAYQRQHEMSSGQLCVVLDYVSRISVLLEVQSRVTKGDSKDGKVYER